jgi:hypothetical protein
MTMNDGAPLQTKSVRLTPQQIKALEKFAQRDRRDPSEVIRIAIDEFFERRKHRETVPA